MAFGTVRVSAKVDRAAVSGLDAGAFQHAVLRRWLQQFFTPRELRARVAGVWTRRDLLAPDGTRWLGEEGSPGSPLTRLTPDFSLFDLVEAGGDWDVTCAGGLFHAPPVPDLPPDWYGRIVYPTGALGDIVSSRVVWDSDLCIVSVGFPFAGYPLTSHLPGVDADFRYLGPAPADLVRVNREHLLALFRQLPDALRVPAGALTWTVDWREAGLPDDQAYLQEFEAALATAGRDQPRPGHW